MNETAKKLLDTELAEAETQWKTRENDINTIEKIGTLAQQTRGRIVIIDVLGILATESAKVQKLVDFHAARRAKTVHGEFCLPRKGAREFVTGLRQQNQVKIITPQNDELVDQLKKYGIVNNEDTFEGIYPPLIRPDRLQEILKETKTPWELSVLHTQNTGRFTMPNGGTYVSSKAWNLGEVGLTVWKDNAGLLTLAEALSKGQTAYIRPESHAA